MGDFSSVASTNSASWINTMMGRVFATMGIGLGITALVAFLVSSNPALMAAIFGSAWKWPVMLAPLGFVFAMGLGYDHLKASTLKALFYAYSAIQGFSLSIVFVVYTSASIVGCFVTASVLFFALAAYGYFTKKDLTKFGGFLFAALIGLLVAMIVNIFLKSAIMGFVISIVGVFLFLALTAYDTQKIRDLLWNEKEPEKAVILGALTLYLDLYNLFLFLLQLFGVKVKD